MQCTACIYLVHAGSEDSELLHNQCNQGSGDNHTVPVLYMNDTMRGRMSMGKVAYNYLEAAKVLTLFSTGCSSDGSGQNSAQQQSNSENSQLHLDQEQLR